MVTKSQIAKFDSTRDWRLFFRVGRIHNGGLDTRDRPHAPPARSAALIKIHDIANRNQRPDQPEEIHVEFSELADGDLAAHGQWHTHPNDDHGSKPDQKSH